MELVQYPFSGHRTRKLENYHSFNCCRTEEMQVVLLENILLDFVYTLCAIYCHIKRNVNFNGMAMHSG